MWRLLQDLWHEVLIEVTFVYSAWPRRHPNPPMWHLLKDISFKTRSQQTLKGCARCVRRRLTSVKFALRSKRSSIRGQVTWVQCSALTFKTCSQCDVLSSIVFKLCCVVSSWFCSPVCRSSGVIIISSWLCFTVCTSSGLMSSWPCSTVCWSFGVMSLLLYSILFGPDRRHQKTGSGTPEVT